MVTLLIFTASIRCGFASSERLANGMPKSNRLLDRINWPDLINDVETRNKPHVRYNKEVMEPKER